MRKTPLAAVFAGVVVLATAATGVGAASPDALSGYSAGMSAVVAERVRHDSPVLLVQPDGVASIAAQTLSTAINRVDAELSPTANINGSDQRVNVDVAVIDTGIDLDHPHLNVCRSQVICGIDYVTGHASEIAVASMSLGGSGDDRWACGTNRDALHEAICNSVNVGVTYVVAAGNSAANASGFVPTAYDEAVTVSTLADFNGRSGGGHNTISGTSMSTPHVSGGAALYKATHPSASPSAVKSALQAAGTSNWNTVTAPDATHEPLLNVATF